FVWMLSRNHPVTELDSTEELIRTYCTPHPSLTSPILPNGQQSEHPAFRLIPQQVRQRIHRDYLRSAIRRAAKEDKHVHLWTHTYNMANEAQYHGIKYCLRELAEQRSNGNLVIKRMKDLPEVDANGE
ncbi:MAG: hypothetical protein ABEI86_09845, partial [Halobacteriaceae archaeon]